MADRQEMSQPNEPPSSSPSLPPLPPPLHITFRYFLKPLPSATTSLFKQKSWSPGIDHDEAWQRCKRNYGRRRSSNIGRSKSITDEDLDELKVCIELGFDFDSLEMDQRMSDTFLAYGIHHAVNQNYNDTVSKASSTSECDSSSPIGGPLAIFGPDSSSLLDLNISQYFNQDMDKESWRHVFSVAIYKIWLWRNMYIFQGRFDRPPAFAFARMVGSLVMELSLVDSKSVFRDY